VKTSRSAQPNVVQNRHHHDMFIRMGCCSQNTRYDALPHRFNRYGIRRGHNRPPARWIDNKVEAWHNRNERIGRVVAEKWGICLRRGANHTSQRSGTTGPNDRERVTVQTMSLFRTIGATSKRAARYARRLTNARTRTSPSPAPRLSPPSLRAASVRASMTVPSYTPRARSPKPP